jgi:hypothetical protein
VQTYTAYFEQELRKLIQEKIEDIKEQMSRGYCQDYVKAIGIVEGLRDVFDLCDEVNKKIGNILT